MTTETPNNERYRRQHSLTAEDIIEAGITHGHVKAWVEANPTEGRNLARAVALMSGGIAPSPHRLAGWIESTATDCVGLCPLDLVKAIAAMAPVAGLVTVPTCDAERFSEVQS
jgi:hypothetical protein